MALHRSLSSKPPAHPGSIHLHFVSLCPSSGDVFGLIYGASVSSASSWCQLLWLLLCVCLEASRYPAVWTSAPSHCHASCTCWWAACRHPCKHHCWYQAGELQNNLESWWLVSSAGVSKAKFSSWLLKSPDFVGLCVCPFLLRRGRTSQPLQSALGLGQPLSCNFSAGQWMQDEEQHLHLGFTVLQCFAVVCGSQSSDTAGEGSRPESKHAELGRWGFGRAPMPRCWPGLLSFFP